MASLAPAPCNAWIVRPARHDERGDWGFALYLDKHLPGEVELKPDQGHWPCPDSDENVLTWVLMNDVAQGAE
jgi:hypothetical protein